MRKEAFTLKTARQDIWLSVEPENDRLRAKGSLLFAPIILRDENGDPNLMARKSLMVTVSGSAVLQGPGCANPSCEDAYDGNVCDT